MSGVQRNPQAQWRALRPGPAASRGHVRSEEAGRGRAPFQGHWETQPASGGLPAGDKYPSVRPSNSVCKPRREQTAGDTAETIRDSPRSEQDPGWRKAKSASGGGWDVLSNVELCSTHGQRQDACRTANGPLRELRQIQSWFFQHGGVLRHLKITRRKKNLVMIVADGAFYFRRNQASEPSTVVDYRNMRVNHNLKTYLLFLHLETYRKLININK